MALRRRLSTAFTPLTGLWLALLGVGVGAFGTLVGAGGGFVLTPALLLLYPHDSPQRLTAISLVAVFFNALSGSIAYGRQRRTDFRAGSLFALATLPGAVGGALVVGLVDRAVFDRLMGGVLVALALWLGAGRGRGEPTERRPLALGVVASLGVGFVSSFLGIGGGVIHVPLLVRALGFPTHVATATSHFVLAVMAGAASVTHVLRGSFSHGHGLRRALALSAGVVLGAQIGARASLRVSGRTIQLLLAVALLALGARLLAGVG